MLEAAAQWRRSPLFEPCLPRLKGCWLFSSVSTSLRSFYVVKREALRPIFYYDSFDKIKIYKTQHIHSPDI